jgi:hypothetical protein
MNIEEKKKHHLFVVLTGIFLTNALLAQIIGVKIFSAEKTIGVNPAQLDILGFVLDFNLTAGVIIWPVVFLGTDIINEYFGKAGVKKVSYMAVTFISYAFLVIYTITLLAPADFWLDVNATDADGNSFNIDFAFNKIFTQGLGIIVGSLIAFLIGQFLDVFIFQKLRKYTGAKMLWLRATGSTLVSQLVDSFVVLGIAFYLLAPEGSRWSITQVVSVGSINYIYKFTVAILLTPMIYLGHYAIEKYLGKELAKKMSDEAAAESE